MTRLNCIAATALLLAAQSAMAGTFGVVGSIPGNVDGAPLFAALTEYGGLLYGTSSFGGAAAKGSIYTVDRKTGATKVVYSFKGGADGESPNGAVVEAGGVFYGSTTYGGASDGGTLFAFDPKTNTETTLQSFSLYGAPGPLTLADGLLYGTLWRTGNHRNGTLFSLDPATNTLATVYTFPGAASVEAAGPLTYADGKLYGVTLTGGKNSGGLMFSFDPATGVGKTVYNFEGGFGAYGALTYANHLLYGFGSNEIYTFDQGSGTLAVIATGISAGSGPMPAAGTTLYGTTTDSGSANRGSIFALDTSTNVLTTMYNFSGGSDGKDPMAGLTEVGGTLYGVTEGGGANSRGTVFSFDPATNTEATLHSFRPVNSWYASSLLRVGPDLYGTVFGGGDFSQGAIIRVNLASQAVTNVYSFAGGADGGGPQAELIDIGGVLYGTTETGGTAGLGTVFSFNPATKTETALYSFAGGTGDGAAPAAALLAQGSVLYGTTTGGGANAGGTIFRFDPASNTETMLYSLQDGSPRTSALTNVNGVLYGTTQGGGASGQGFLFGFDPTSNTIVQSYGFPGPVKGWGPMAGLLNLAGTLWGTAWDGGPANGGAAFRFDTASGAYKIAHAFPDNSAAGASPDTNLVQLGHELYGLTAFGVLYALKSGSGSATVDYQLPSGSNGGVQMSAPIAVGHVLYGAASGGGDFGAGYIYKYTP